jgi:FkbM family methyltransferase
LKNSIIYFLQRVLGFGNYLFVFSWYKVLTLKRDQRENDFFHFISLLNDKDTVLDIGANLGFMTYHLSKKVQSGEVYSFEPIPENIRTILRIKKFFRLNNVVVQDYALGNETKTLTMVMPVIGKARKQGLSHVIDEKQNGHEGVLFKVEQNRLDDITFFKERKIQGIKIDVENYEFQVFDGARALIGKNRPYIYCELWDNENRNKCFQIMLDLGYTIQVLVAGELTLFQPDKHHTQNFFFIPASH